MSAAQLPPALAAEGIVKRFGAVVANREASLEVAAGEIHAVVGENGAGKSTLMRVLSGMYSPDAGRVLVNGRDVTGWSARAAIAAGVGMVHQHFMLVPTLTVAENVMLGHELRRGWQLDRAAAATAVQQLSQRTGLAVTPTRRVAELSVGEAQRVEILKTLFRGARILILDEPTAVLSPPEVQELWAVLRRLRADGGTVVLITHKLDEVIEISETITVMRAGRTVERMRTAAATPAVIARAMVGRDVALVGDALGLQEAALPAASLTQGSGDATAAGAGVSAGSGAPPVSGAHIAPGQGLEVRELVVASARRAREVDGVSFTVPPGEIFGIAGVEGNGQTELIEALAGLRPVASGSIRLNGRECTHASVRERADAGLSHIPEDRHRRGLVLDYSVADNLILGLQHRFTRRGRLDRAAIAANARERVQRFDIRPPDSALPARALSGGNQQKIVIAREMGRDFRVLLASQPTRGVDVGAIEFIHEQLRGARDSRQGGAAGERRPDGSAGAVRRHRRHVRWPHGHGAAARRGHARVAGRVDDRCGQGSRSMSAQPANSPVSAAESGPRRRLQYLESVLPPLVAILIAAVIGDVLILVFGQSPAEVYRQLFEGTWGNAYGFGQVLYKTTTLTCTGLAVAIGMRAGVFNIGAESQLAAGGFSAAIMGLALPPGTPVLLAVPLCLLAACAGGGLVGLVPGVLKARYGASEVIVTIMLNFIVLALLNWIVASHLHVPETLHTPEIHAGGVARLADVFAAFHGSAANFTLLFALAAAALTGWYLFRTRGGYELRAAGLQPDAAEYGGVKVGRVWLRALVLGGVLAGLGGVNFVSGYKHYYEEGFAGGAGFLGIAVALVGRNHPLGVVLAALLFATLSQGGLAVGALVPKQMVDVLTAVVIIAVVTAMPEVRRLLRARRAIPPTASPSTGARTAPAVQS